MAIINGTIGNDSLLGTAAADTLNGSDGNDTLNGFASGDRLSGGAGIDTAEYVGAAGAVAVNLVLNTATGGSGNDTLAGIENVIGSEFGDTLSGSAGANVLDGRSGNDVINGGVGNDLLIGGAGNDSLSGGDGRDTLQGSADNDQLRGDAGNDSIEGGDGNDFITGGSGDDQLVGGNGTDTADYFFTDTSAAVTVNLALGTATGGGGRDTLSGIENVFGSDFGDTLRGNDASNSFDARGGNDLLIGAGGADSFIGGAGNDTMNGGAILERVNYTDRNSVSYLSSTAGIDMNLQTGIVQDGLGGTDQLVNINFVTASNFNDAIRGSDTIDLFEQFDAGLGDDTIDGGAIDPISQQNSNRVNYSAAGGAVNVNFATGTATGAAGNDTLIQINHVRGSGFSDILTGSDTTFTEQFEGLAGDDTINGAGGTDMVRYDSAAVAINASLVTNVVNDGHGGTDTLLNIEGIRGSAFADVITGGNTANGTGATDGFEFFIGNGGNDTIDGGGGFDRADYTTALQGGVAVTLGGTGTGTALDGLGGSDTLISIEGVRGSVFNDTLTGSDTGSFESFEGRQGNDTINGLGGIDRADYNSEVAAVTVDLTSGTAVDGSGGIDTLLNIEDVRGSFFGDEIIGSAANNRLVGGSGNDTLQGLGGNDVLSGGEGVDYAIFRGALQEYTIAFDAATQSYTVTDLVAGRDGTDTLQGVQGIGFEGSSGVVVKVNPAGTYLSTASGDTTPPPTSVSLADLNMATGSMITLSRIGDYQAGSTGFTDSSTSMVAVFANINPSTGAITFVSPQVNLGTPTQPQALTGQGTDIPQDFAVPGNGAGLGFVQVVVPVGATHILFSPNDSFFSDNTDPDGDYSVLIQDGGVASNAGNDILNGTNGSDLLLGGAGRDAFMGGAGNDTMDGGAITERINYTDLNSVAYFSSPNGITMNLQTGVVLDGFGGTDQLANINFVTGSNFNDSILGSTTVDLFEQFEGGGGNDTIDGGVIDTLVQANGNRVSYAGANGAVTVNLGAGVATGAAGTDTLLNINHVRGGNFGDVLVGSNTTALTENLEGLAGNDTIDGAGGFDVVRYDSASSAVNVNLTTGVAQDGQGGTDTLLNVEGLRGSAFSDNLFGGNPANGSGALDGFEFFIGNAGNDSIDGGAGYDRVDYTTSTSGVSVTLGGAGLGNALDGFGGTDVLANIEAVRGSIFNDTLTGSDSAAFESFEGRQGSDVMDGRGGTDRVDYANDIASVTVQLINGTAVDGSGGADTLLNIENARGSSFADALVGSGGANRLEGNAGRDTLIGADGNDQVDGGANFDVAVYGGTRAGYAITFGTGSVSVSNGTFTDTVSNVEQLLFEDGAQVLLYNNALFDPLRYIASNTDLIVAFGLNADSAAQHYAQTGYDEGRRADFDGLRYIASNPDLMAAFGTDAAAATRHWITNGFAEGRSATSFSPMLYLASNTDLLQAFGADTNAATLHYLNAGSKEGRGFGFDAVEYLAANVDVLAAVGPNLEAAATHYVTTGFAQGRGFEFAALNYIASYPDLMAAFGTNTEAATAHFVFGGFAEGRQVTFSPIQYALGNPDLIGAFGFNQDALATHWIVAGSTEGRSASLAAIVGTSAGDTLTGGGAADVVLGLGGNDVLNGGPNHDLLIGGAGNDVMTGGAGNLDLDVFQYASVAEAGDSITDFAPGTDKLAFASFGFGFMNPGQLDASRLAASSAALGAGAGFVYDQASGILSFDADGAGAAAAVAIVGIGAGQALAAGDILILG